MKRKAILIMALLAAGLVFPAASRAQIAVKARLIGGMGLFSGGDLNKGAEGMFNFYDAVLRAIGFETRGEFTPAQAGFDFGGDLILQFHENFGVGIGLDWLQASLESTDEFQSADGAGAFRHRVRLSATPLKLSLFYFLPIGLGEKYNVFFRAGLGYFPGRANYRVRWESGSAWTEREYDASAVGVGFQGGAGVEIALTPQLGIVLEAAGRYAGVSGFEGESIYRDSDGDSQTERGTLYYFDYAPSGGTFPMLEISDGEISGPGISNVRKARVHYSGLSVVAGLFLRF